MRILTLLATLLVLSTIYAHAQYHGRCGNFRYTIKGKLVSSVEIDNVTISTYYSIEQRTGYIWFWKEISEPNTHQTNEFISMWARLTDIDTSCVESFFENASTIKVRLNQKQNFFFTTTYVQKKNGPAYGVRNDILILFKTDEAATNFSNEIKRQIPNYNY